MTNKFLLLSFLSVVLFLPTQAQQFYTPNYLAEFESFLLQNSPKDKSIRIIQESFIPGYIPFLIEIMHYTGDQNTNDKLFSILKDNTTDRSLGQDYFDWLPYIWNRPESYPYYYFDFKAALYKAIDPKFETYFKGRYDQATIRLDEVVWGGVKQDGIPPLRYPKMIPAKRGTYLADSDIVFGIEVDGEARAYPQRILGWHEMVVDKIGKKEIAGVYCTLCGTMIAYDQSVDGQLYELGTSGFLYRSNKLMYDKNTQSLWNTIEGKPVIGPLVGQGLELETHSVYTTTWSEWKAAYPKTKVLDLNTGYERNYEEGAAYRAYYATDELMFPVPEFNTSLLNKTEVMVLKGKDYEQDPIAISANRLNKLSVLNLTFLNENVQIVTNEANISRAFLTKEIKLKINRQNKILDQFGVEWQYENAKLFNEKGQVIEEIPTHRIFWFAWYNAFPETRLVD